MTSSGGRWLGVSTTATTPAGTSVELVHGADGDRVGEPGGEHAELGASEPVAVALDDGDEPGVLAGDAVDVPAPRLGVDGQPQRHADATGPGRERGEQRSRLTLGNDALPEPDAVGEVVDEPGNATAEERRDGGGYGDDAYPAGDERAGDEQRPPRPAAGVGEHAAGLEVAEPGEPQRLGGRHALQLGHERGRRRAGDGPPASSGCPASSRAHAAPLHPLTRTGASAPGWRSASGAADEP